MRLLNIELIKTPEGVRLYLPEQIKDEIYNYFYREVWAYLEAPGNKPLSEKHILSGEDVWVLYISPALPWPQAIDVVQDCVDNLGYSNQGRSHPEGVDIFRDDHWQWGLLYEGDD